MANSGATRPRGTGEPGLFDRICRENGITHRLTAVRSPITTGKVERLHLTLRRELLDGHEPFADLAAAQAAVDAWRAESPAAASPSAPGQLRTCSMPHPGVAAP